MGDERVWLKHGEHGGYFHCPADAVDEWSDLGWEPSDAPEEFNPVTAERIAAEQAAAEQRAAEEAAAKAAKKSTRSSRDSGTQTESQE